MKEKRNELEHSSTRPELVVVGDTDGPTPRYRTVLAQPRRHALPLESVTARLIHFFRSDGPVSVNRVKLAVALVAGVIAPLVLALSAAVFSSNRRCR